MRNKHGSVFFLVKTTFNLILSVNVSICTVLLKVSPDMVLEQQCCSKIRPLRPDNVQQQQAGSHWFDFHGMIHLIISWPASVMPAFDPDMEIRPSKDLSMDSVSLAGDT